MDDKDFDDLMHTWAAWTYGGMPMCYSSISKFEQVPTEITFKSVTFCSDDILLNIDRCVAGLGTVDKLASDAVKARYGCAGYDYAAGRVIGIVKALGVSKGEYYAALKRGKCAVQTSLVVFAQSPKKKWR